MEYFDLMAECHSYFQKESCSKIQIISYIYDKHMFLMCGCQVQMWMKVLNHLLTYAWLYIVKTCCCFFVADDSSQKDINSICYMFHLYHIFIQKGFVFCLLHHIKLNIHSLHIEGWSWSYGSWIYSYLCNQYH